MIRLILPPPLEGQPDDPRDAVVEIINALAPKDFTAKGAPKLTAVRKAFGSKGIADLKKRGLTLTGRTLTEIWNSMQEEA